MSQTRIHGSVSACAIAVMGVALLFATPVGAQTAEDRYFSAVADYFSVSPVEVSILGEWDMDPEEVPVVLFVARRAGVPPDVVVAQRQTGATWAEVSGRYRMNASAFHVPVAGDSGGSLSRALTAYRSTPERDWFRIELDDADIVALVNLRFMSQNLSLPPGDVLRARDQAGSYVAGYQALRRSRP